MKQVYIFSDGSSLGNPGPGGFGAILRYMNHELELSKGYKTTTNNRMELRGVIESIKKLKEPCNIIITTDSKYVIDGFTKWIFNWKKDNWQTAIKKQIKNIDLWKELYEVSLNHKMNWIWVKGHDGHAENERCDKLAKQAATNSLLLEDIGYNAN